MPNVHANISKRTDTREVWRKNLPRILGYFRILLCNKGILFNFAAD